MQWGQAGKTRKYTFTYDNLSRLKTAAYTGESPTNFAASYSYDKHGNIKTLQRYGMTAASAYGIIDNLTAEHTGNQLKYITDAGPNVTLNASMDFKDYTKGATTEYTYNANGAMVKDMNKGISQITYNTLNLPQIVDIKNMNAEGRNEYTYSASGQKLKAIQKWNPNYYSAPVIGSDINVSSLTMSTTTDYVGNIIYENNTLKRILVDGGYNEGGNYYFYINDHLGNNRIVANAAASVVQSTQYYPFGMPFADATGASVQPYKYNNKELDGRNGLNMYDYSARQMDFALPGFTTVDPLAEKFYSISPYVYCLNNPIRLIDPDGKAPMGGPGWPVNPVDYQRMVVSQKVDQAIKANSSTIQKNGALAVASLSDINDAVVLGTTITRGSSGAVNVDGTPAGGIGVGAAALGAILPAISGSAVKSGLKAIGEALGIGRKAEGVIIRSGEDIVAGAIKNGPEKIGSYTIDGTKGVIGDTFARNIFSISADKGGKSVAGFNAMVKTMEKEAVSTGASKISIQGHTVQNAGFLNPNTAARYGYDFKDLGKDGVLFQKNLKP